ncbi:NADH-quinone oxidoreductase subunit NuoH [Micropruina sonneratiae]|uniref:NADH-quinone oxidoreductase subunit NuoH n=1 Tax=Micropruina sonneratiae TaxID=2986940 RepID=UPI0022277984|nr:NADH-quinone oxidoreductase subunit NuoH [Micropruina sp. KQZ13P-5]MCW3158098.1 NADH-quinone oxidoreductase subunit NuoH [Micropruina sp. KQZ13P-5]
MIPLDLSLFGTDPWWLVLIKVVVLFVVLLVWTIFNVWYERRLVGKMQHRLGPIMNGPFGLGQALADGMKLLIKEDFRPKAADRVLFTLAPLIAGTAAFAAWAVIPFGGEVEIFGVRTRLQATDLPISVLVILAVASVGIYGFVLAGWSSNSPYSLLGALRSSAQMISYELSMGLALVAVFLYSRSMSTSEIVDAQGQPFIIDLPQFGIHWDLGLQNWYFLLLFPSFVIYLISMVGETNRAPFDLPECESELVSGYLTEYSGFRYAIYFLAEYINMATVSAVATTLFLGGYHAPWPINALFPAVDTGWWGPLWFVLKVQLLISVFVWLRGTLPRFRYDQFMNLGWKWLIPISLVWVMLVATARIARAEGWFTPTVMVIAGVVVVALFALWWLLDREPEPDIVEEVAFDPFAGGYPVPPMPGQKLPEQVDVLPAEPERTDA